MNNRVYESAALINAALEDEVIQNTINRIKDTISENGGTLRDIEDWGRKRLAYIVRKSKIGYYVIFRYNAPPELIPKLERFFQLDENILRYLSVKLSKDALEQIELDRSQQSGLAEEEEPAPANTVDEVQENSVTENN